MRGFTLLEILIVVAIIGTIAGFSFIYGIQNYFSYATDNERNTIVALILKARSEAVNNICLGASCSGGLPHGFKIVYDPQTGEVSKYSLFQGSTYSASDELNQDISPSYELYLAPSQSNPLKEFSFQQLSGSVASGGSVVLQDESGHSFTISVNSEGRVAW